MRTSFFFFFSLLCFFKCKTEKQNIVFRKFEWRPVAGWWTSNTLIPIVGDEQGRQCGRDHTIDLCLGRTCVWKIQDRIRRERERERERERGRERHKECLYSWKGNNYKWQPTFTKGYKVTLYSDWLRATALYAIKLQKWPELGLSKRIVWIRPLYICIRHSPVMGVYMGYLKIQV